MKLAAFTRLSLASAGFTIALLKVAKAGVIVTPILFLGGGNQVVCIANNASNQTLTVRVTILSSVNSSFTTEVCTLTPTDRAGCQEFLNGAGHCRISVTTLTNAQVDATVRGVFFARTTSPPFTIGPVVQAE
jgi:hypothetical protein